MSESRRRLARHAACKDINPANRVSTDGFDVSEVWHAGEVVLIDEALVGVDFGIGDSAESFGFKGEAEASDPGKKVNVGEIINGSSVVSTVVRFC